MEKQLCVELPLALRTGWRWTAGMLLVLGLWTQAANAGLIVIDDFTLPESAEFFKLPKGMNPVQKMSYESDGAIGNVRDMTISVIGQGKANSVVGLIGHDATPTFDMDALQIGTNGLAPAVTNLLYGGAGVPVAIPAAVGTSGFVNAHALGDGGGVDLTGGGTDPKFVIHYLGLDAQPYEGLNVTITITSAGGKTSTVTDVAPNSIPAFTFSIPFTKLNGNADPKNVDSISVTFNGENHNDFQDHNYSAAPIANVDFAVQLIGVESIPVPEPATATLGAIALGAVGWAGWRKRRRRKPCTIR